MAALELGAGGGGRGLNLYRQSASYDLGAVRIRGAESVNPRALELAACGVFTIADHRAEAAEVFGDLVPTFRTPDELGGLIRRWLADDAGRRGIAAALPLRVPRSTFTHRAERLGPFLRAIQQELDARSRQGVA
jgi:glycosyltransferase involved in cell wall biosynthesis